MAQVLDILLLAPLLLTGLTVIGARRGAEPWLQRRAPAVEAGPALQLGPYTLGSKLGAGGMGEVYRAYNSALGAWHALKLLPPHASPSARRRFEKEARLGALVRHPNTVAILEPAEEGQGTCYYAMELIEGTSLAALVEREGPQPPARVARVLGQLAAALEELHAHGLVHRDIKPDNVLVCGPEHDVCKLIDFGLVEHVDALAEGQPEGSLIGTPLYLSPEAIVAPETVGPASDLYGLGALGYFLLRGEPVFRASTLLEACCHHLHSAPEPLRLGGEDAAELERVVLECLAKRPEERPTAVELARRLARGSGPRSTRARGALAASHPRAAAPGPRCPIAA